MLVSLCGSTIMAQAQIRTHQERLKRIRNEIRSVEKEIEASKKEETSILDQLNELDLDIDLAQTTIQNLKREQRRKAEQIERIEKNLQATREELTLLKEIFARRLVHAYKYGRVKDLELLLTASSFNEGLLWLEYEHRMAEHDYRSFVKIKEKQTEIARNKDLLTLELQEQKTLLADKLKEEKKLRQQKQQREKLLSKIRENTDLLRQRLAQKEQAAAQIQQLITKLEQTPVEAPLLKPATTFTELKGRMIWPTEGKIIAKFGRYRHPELKTITENIGIDIQAPMGSPVRAVASGKVTAIEWQRGLGNIVIIKHYGGYYSVYTHLEQISVNLMQDVSMGNIIGNVGESGSIKGPVLHFEIWKGTDKLNPEEWLGKNT